MSRRFNDGYQNLKKSLISGGCRCRQSTVLSEEEDTYELFRKNIISMYNQGLKNISYLQFISEIRSRSKESNPERSDV